MPNLVILMLLVLSFPLVIMLIGDKWINRFNASLTIQFKLIGTIPRRLVTSISDMFKATEPTYHNKRSRFRQEAHKHSNKASAKDRFIDAFELHFSPINGKFKVFDVHRIGGRFYSDFSNSIHTLKGNSFRSYRNKLYQQIHPDKAANSHFTVDEATSIFQYFNEHFPKQ